MTFFPVEPAGLLLWDIQPDASELRRGIRGALRLLNTSSIVPAVVTFSSENSNGVWGSPRASEWVLSMWIQDIALRESKTYFCNWDRIGAALWPSSLDVQSPPPGGGEVERAWEKRIETKSVWCVGWGRCALTVMVKLSKRWGHRRVHMQRFPFTPRMRSRWDTPCKKSASKLNISSQCVSSAECVREFSSGRITLQAGSHAVCIKEMKPPTWDGV